MVLYLYLQLVLFDCPCLPSSILILFPSLCYCPIAFSTNSVSIITSAYVSNNIFKTPTISEHVCSSISLTPALFQYSYSMEEKHKTSRRCKFVIFYRHLRFCIISCQFPVSVMNMENISAL